MLAVIFVFGLLVGSFLNALIYRLHTGESMLDAHSRCPECGHDLGFLDLFPLLSFLFLRGKCRYCQKPISWQYPVVELVTGISFLLLAQNFQFPISDFQFWFQAAFSCFLIVIFVYDLKHYLILDKVVFPGLLLALVYQYLFGDIISGLIGSVVLSGFFLVLYLVSRGRWIGFGDVKLGLFLGMIAGWPVVIVTFFLAYLFGSIVAVPLLLFKQRKLADKLPFGTFLTLSAFVAMIWGEGIIEWYFRLIGLT